MEGRMSRNGRQINNKMMVIGKLTIIPINNTVIHINTHINYIYKEIVTIIIGVEGRNNLNKAYHLKVEYWGEGVREGESQLTCSIVLQFD